MHVIHVKLIYITLRKKKIYLHSFILLIVKSRSTYRIDDYANKLRFL